MENSNQLNCCRTHSQSVFVDITDACRYLPCQDSRHIARIVRVSNLYKVIIQRKPLPHVYGQKSGHQPLGHLGKRNPIRLLKHKIQKTRGTGL
jgi:hypothetical protein